MSILTLSAADVPQLMAVQRNCYREELVESEAVMSARISAFSQSCWGYFIDGQLAGYVLAYPSVLGSITPLAADFPVYHNPNCLYLHDMAVANCFRGQALAPQLLNHAKIQANIMGFQALALVAVQGAEAYWTKQGFTTVANITAEQQAVLHSYLPEQACYMVYCLSPQGEVSE